MVGNESGARRFVKVFLILMVFAFFTVSIVYSLNSFTGYVITEDVDNSANLIASVFFVWGLIGSWVYFKNFKR